MGIFLVIVITTVGAALVVNGLLNNVARLGRALVAVGTFLVVTAGAYALSFVFDMIELTRAGVLPKANVVWPCITWALIAVSSLLVGAARIVPFAVRAVPFWLIGGLMIFSSQLHGRPIILGVVLLLGGTAYAAVASQSSTKSRSAEADDHKIRRGLAPVIGPYRIDMKVSEMPHLLELTADERGALNASVAFKNERLYNGPPAQFGGAQWEIVVGAVEGRIYKISALLVMPDASGRDRAWQSLADQLRAPLGAPASAAHDLIAWDTEDGNVIMNRPDAGDLHVVVLTLTSRAVRGFASLP